ncbi:MAG TPA: AAA family ATPase [Candidatus Dormibacteraeota bacterium]|nr:AAA family ATPase [Candidatus Dormibacteraeota bacterium]
MSGLPPVVTAMLAPGFYPEPPAHVDLLQTHISYVLLAGDQVYKLKKPVRFAFLDFSTLERRRHFCEEEVRLNRRLAGDVYRGVLAIVPCDGGFAPAPADAAGAVEYAVHMRRLPAERVLARLLDTGAATAALIDRIAARLAAFHAGADAGPEIAHGGDPAEIARLMDEDFAEVVALHGDTISAADDAAIQRWCHARLAALEPLLRRRQAAGRIRDGHGDLHAEHIYCLENDELVIVDCIEFNPGFRHRDVAADLAFLAMDLEYHGRRDLAARLIATYAERAADPELPALVPFYACQRAYIRGKVDSLKSREPEVEPADAAAARASAGRHFALALRYTWSDARALIIVCGLSGSGKSTIAAALAARTGFVHLNTDRTRKALAGLAATERGGPELYSAERSAATYAALHTAAGEALAAGRGVILDGTFQRREHRDRARAVADAAGAPALIVECRADDAEIRRRLTARAARNDDPSDADWEVYQRQRLAYEAVAADEPHVAVDTARPTAEVVAEAEARLRELVKEGVGIPSP